MIKFDSAPPHAAEFFLEQLSAKQLRPVCVGVADAGAAIAVGDVGQAVEVVVAVAG